MTIATEPLFLGARNARLKFWGMPRKPGDPKRVEGTFTVIGDEGDLVLDAFIGPQGEPGEPMAPWRIEWDSTITDPGDLPSVATMDESDDGRAWVIGTHLYVYVDALGVSGEYRSIDAGVPGPIGATPDVGASAELVRTTDPNDLTIEVVESGPSYAPNFHLKVPTAPLIGPVGPSTAIRLAPDYDNTVPPYEGQGIVWDDALEKYRPGDLSPMAVNMLTIPHVNFVNYSGSAGRILIASLDLPALDHAWYPDVTGHLRLARNVFSSVAVEVEVRIGDTGVGTGETADLCGLAPYDPVWALLDAVTVLNIMPHFSDAGNPARAVAPDAPAGRVPAGQAKTLYVFLHKTGGSGTYTFNNSLAQVRLFQVPVS